MILNEEQYYKDRIFNLQNALKTKNDEIRQLVTENNNLEARIIYLEARIIYLEKENDKLVKQLCKPTTHIETTIDFEKWKEFFDEEVEENER